jgi:hypothetical protein
MRRDNPDYYVNSFISGLTDYIQAHLQCHKANDLQQAMWLARRMDPATVQKKSFSTFQNAVKRQVQFDSKPANTTPAVVIHEAKIQSLC